MRLKDHVNAREAGLFGRRQCGADFGGVMPIVVNHRNATNGSLELKSAVHTQEGPQSLPTVIAAVALRTLCWPGTCNPNSPRSWSLYRTRNRFDAEVCWPAIDSARKSASWLIP